MIFSVPKRNTGISFERPAKILRGLRRFGNNLAAAEASAWTLIDIKYLFRTNEIIYTHEGKVKKIQN